MNDDVLSLLQLAVEIREELHVPARVGVFEGRLRPPEQRSDSFSDPAAAIVPLELFIERANRFRLQAGQNADALMNFLRMEKWLSDRPDHTGAAAQQWLKELYQENKLVRGELSVDGRLVDLKAIDMPVLNIYSETDTVIHPLASKALRGHVGSKDYTELPVSGGHIGIFVARSKKLANGIVDWLAKH